MGLVPPTTVYSSALVPERNDASLFHVHVIIIVYNVLIENMDTLTGVVGYVHLLSHVRHNHEVNNSIDLRIYCTFSTKIFLQHIICLDLPVFPLERDDKDGRLTGDTISNYRHTCRER